jgi:hypothetical protein
MVAMSGSYAAQLAEVDRYLDAFQRSGAKTLVPLLPVLFKFKREPYSLSPGHEPMRPMFRLDPPKRSLWKCARQTGKSLSQAHQGVALSIAISDFNTLFVTPLKEQIQRFSSLYVKPAINNCILREMVAERTFRGRDSVLQKTMPHNNSTMFFSYAFSDADRTRGINADRFVVDEVQGINKEFLGVMRESMSASDWGLEQYAGTPLSLSNTVEYLWKDSSMAEWAIKCKGCGYTSVMKRGADLESAIGLHGLVCPKCDKGIDTEHGYWLHGHPERRNYFEGHHAPQCIFPMHCRNKVKWFEFLKKRDTEFAKWMMECCAESYDIGTRLVSEKNLEEASTLPWANDWPSYLANFRSRGYQFTCLAIDWSGGGSSEVSLTAMACIGITADGKAEVGWLKQFPHSTNWGDDAARVASIFQTGLFNAVVHDFGGAGSGREQVLTMAGFPINKMIPVTYVHTTGQKALMYLNKPAADNVRSSYSLDKSRSVVYTCELIKQGYMKFPKYQTCETNLAHFMALIEESMQTARGSDIYLIGKIDGSPDDMAHAITMGVCACYYSLQKWPDLGKSLLKHDVAMRAALDPDKGSVGRVDVEE